MKENIKKAFELAEQEAQEKEIVQLKGIIKDLLQKKADAEEEKKDIEKEISIIKQTIDDFKAGRLDKVKELIEKDGKAKDLLPFKIIIINQPVITQPWYWTYSIQPNYPTTTTATWTGASGTYTTAGTDSYLTGSCGVTTAYTNTSCGTGSTGNNIATFTTGTYALGSGRIINL